MSFEILNPTPIEEREPRFIYERDAMPPTFRTTYERDAFRARERQRILEGWNFLTGKHYHHLTRIHLKSGTGGKIIRPRWRDVDEFIFQSIDAAEKAREDLYIIKPREVGLTSIGANLPLYYIAISPGCLTGMTSCDTARISNMFNQKLMVSYNAMDKMFKPGLVNKNASKTLSFLKVQLKRYGDDENIYESEVNCPETTDQPSAFSAYRLKYLFIDEFALHRKRELVIASANDALGESGVREGMLICGGTCENGIPQESLDAIRRLVTVSRDEEARRAARFSICFIPAWMGKYKYEDENGEAQPIPGTLNGWNNEQFTTEVILRRRDQLSKLKDKSKLDAFKKNHPLTIDEVLEAVGEGKLPVDLQQLVVDQITKVRIEQPPVFNYSIDVGANGKMVAIPQNDGEFFIFKMPVEYIESGRYIGTNDCIPFGDANVADGSDDCLLIKDTITMEYVAGMCFRNLDAQYMVGLKIRLLIFYQAKMMLEMNRGEVTMQIFKDRGLLHMLARRPTHLGLSTRTGNYGVWRNDPKLISIGNDLFFTYIRNHINKFVFTAGLEQMLRFLLQNNDMVSAIIWGEVYHEELRRKHNRLNNTEENTQTVTIPMRKFVNGKLQLVYQEVTLKKS